VVERHRPRPSGAAAAPEEDLGEPVVLRLVDDKAHADPADPKVELFQMGRAAYYQAASSRVGLGVACATCHPDGRDDGFVWREMQFPDEKGDRSLLMSDPTLAEAATKDGANNWGRKVRPLTDPLGAARQTPMLAGRVGRRGPYGWRGESETLADRVAHGMSLHRTSDASDHGYSKGELGYYAAAIAMFLREGLHVPARADRPLSEQETRGRTLFGSPEVGCVDCHKPDTDYTDGTGYPDIVRTTERYRDEPKLLFRTPSLRFVSGTAPYMHDGSRKTLLGVIEQSGDKMGKTAHLSGEDKRALVAFLETL
jgi:cytochrome c peroxidase